MTPAAGALPRPRVVAALLAGRGVYRAAVYAGGIALLASWGPQTFAGYAAPVGALAWLTAVTAGGPEKAALTLIPLRGGAHLHGFLRALAAASAAVLLATWLLLAAVGSSDTTVRYAASAALAGGIGCATVLVALHRLRGAPLVDSAAYLGIAAAYGLAVVLALAGGGPTLVLEVLAIVVAMVNLALLGGLVRGDRRHPVEAVTEPVTRGSALRAAFVLGAAEFLGTAGVSVLYVVLAAADRADETSLFYVLVLVSAVVSTGWGYLLRLAQPAAVTWIERAGERTGWRTARATLGWTVAFGVPAGVVVGLASVASGGRWPVYVAIVVEIALFAANAVSALLLEVSGARGRGWSARGAVAQFAAVVAVGWALVPSSGALGAVTALIVGEVVRAGLLFAAARAPAEGSSGHPVDGSRST